MTRLVDEVINGYLRRYPGAGEADLTDGMYRWQVRMLRSVLALTDMGLEDEGISERVRAQVVRTALYGSAPNPFEAEQRVQEHAERVENLRRTAVPVRVANLDVLREGL